ncbi:MAG: DUF3857 domain-containing protein [Deltaproteobacteria bacterium]|nr:DUF3857 domain-containing protein [Deltaproteobacteria bacterium]
MFTILLSFILSTVNLSQEDKLVRKLIRGKDDLKNRICLIKKLSPWTGWETEKNLISIVRDKKKYIYFYSELKSFIDFRKLQKIWNLKPLYWDTGSSGVIHTKNDGSVDNFLKNERESTVLTKSFFLKKKGKIVLYIFPEVSVKLEINDKKPVAITVPSKVIIESTSGSLNLKLSTPKKNTEITALFSSEKNLITDFKSKKRKSGFVRQVRLIKSPFHTDKNLNCENKNWSFYSKYLGKWKSFEENYTLNIRVKNIFTEYFGIISLQDYSVKYPFLTQWKPVKTPKNGVIQKIQKISELEGMGLCLSAVKQISLIKKRFGPLLGILEYEIALRAACRLDNYITIKELINSRPWDSRVYSYLDTSVQIQKISEIKSILNHGFNTTGSFSILKQIYGITGILGGKLAEQYPEIWKKFIKSETKYSFKGGKCNSSQCNITDEIFNINLGKTKIEKSSSDKNIVINDEQVIVIRKDNTASFMQYKLVYIGKPEKHAPYSYQNIRFSPMSQYVTVIRNRIIKKNGRVLENIARQKVWEVNDPASKMFYDIKELQLEFNPLEKGDMYEVVWRIDGLPAANSLGGLFFGSVFLFQDEIPRKKAVITVYREGSNVVAVPSVKTTVSTGKFKNFSFKRFVLNDVKGIQVEPGMPGWGETMSHLQTGLGNSWRKVGKNYYDFISSRYVINSEILNLQKKITQGAVTRKEKIRKIHSWIQKNIRYVSLMFGMHSYLPYSFDEIYNRKFGDCKDITLMMILMLRSAGIKAWPAAVRTRTLGKISYTVPSLAHFDHSIIYLPETDEWIDTTVRGLLYPRTPAYIQGSKGLVFTSEGGVLKTIPMDSWKDNEGFSHIQLDVDDKGNAKFSVKNKIRGQGEIFSRYLVSGKKIHQLWKKNFIKFKFSKFNDGNSDLVSPYKYSFTGKSVMFIKNPHSKNPYINAGFLDDLMVSNLSTGVSREHDLLLRFPGILKRKIKISLKGKLCFKNYSGNMRISTKNLFWESKSFIQKQKLIISREIILKKNRIAKESYGEFHNSVKKIIQLLNNKVELEKCRKICTKCKHR